MPHASRPSRLLLLAVLALAGCSIPSWVPLIGKAKPAPAGSLEPAPPPAPASAPILTPRAELSPSDEVVDRIIVVVNNDAITLYELDEAEAQYVYESKDRPASAEARQALRQRLLQTMIENRIQLQQAERERVQVEEPEIQEALGEIMRKNNASTPKAFEELLRASGLTIEAVKKRVREMLMVQRLVRRKVGLRVSITEQDIDRYLSENRDKLETGLTFEARHILFLPEPGQGEEGWAAARRKADQVYALLLDGQDFAEMAKRHSQDPSAKDGGFLGTLKRGELEPEIEAAILALRPGEFSAPFRSRVGVHLFQLASRESLSGEALGQARNQIRDILYRQRYETRLKEWLAEIKQRAIIEVRM
jgi:peptidyl-prolyl cis-trans isomerase SurA